MGSRAMFKEAEVLGGVSVWGMESAVVKQRGCVKGTLSSPGLQGREGAW